jgi:hypothetical protein
MRLYQVEMNGTLREKKGKAEHRRSLNEQNIEEEREKNRT